jgi:hypothetical protein
MLKAVFVAPAPASAALAVFKSFTSVQLVPFQDSVAPVGPLPPNPKAAVFVPAPAN